MIDEVTIVGRYRSTGQLTCDVLYRLEIRNPHDAVRHAHEWMKEYGEKQLGRDQDWEMVCILEGETKMLWGSDE